MKKAAIDFFFESPQSHVQSLSILDTLLVFHSLMRETDL